MKLLTQNSKMKKSTNSKYTIYNFGITAIKTCPMAGNCKTFCYANQGTYNFPNVKTAFETRFEITKTKDFISLMSKEITTKEKTATRKSRILIIRIHDSGDFYNHVYLDKWISIMNMFPNVKFYAYTKMIPLFKRYTSLGKLPTNFRVIYSFGGIADKLIETEKDRNAKVFSSQEELLANDYINGTEDDLIAALGDSNKIGLVYHGNKKISSVLL